MADTSQSTCASSAEACPELTRWSGATSGCAASTTYAREIDRFRENLRGM
jgi:hypothetical protein